MQLVGSEWVRSRPGRFIPGKEPPHPRSFGGPQGPSGHFGEEKPPFFCLDSSVTVVTTSRAGLSGRGKIFFLVLLSSATGGLFPLTTRLNRVLKLRISGAMPLFSSYAFLACTWASLRLSVCGGPTLNCIQAACGVRFRFLSSAAGASYVLDALGTKIHRVSELYPVSRSTCSRPP